MTTYNGVLHFHSETGSEGGYWAFQDAQFMGLPAPNQWWCPRCCRIWDKDQYPEEPKPSFTYWVDRETLSEQQNPKRYISGYMGFDAPQEGTLIDPATGREFPVSEGPSEIDQAFTHASNETSRQCYEQGHERWISPQERFPEGTWSYEGLHVLKNGDRVTIYDKNNPSVVVWEGVMDLQQHDLFTEHAGGMWIHADQKGIDRDVWASWFFNEHPAELDT